MDIYTRGTGQTGARDRSDRLACSTPCTRSHPTAEVLSSKRSLLRDAAILTKIRSAVLEGPRNPGRWPVLRKPPKPHAREDSRLHAVAQTPFPPRPSDGPRRRPTPVTSSPAARPYTPSTPVASASPETDARASTTWRLQPPSACLALWRKPRNPPSVAACALDPGMDATAATRPELLHGNSPSTLDARVPAIQRPSARSHHTVDNSLITGRIEYSTFLNLPLDECIVNTP